MTKFVAKRSFDYGGGHRLPGEVFDRQYLRNDELLIRQGRVLDVITDKPKCTDPCADCGRVFITEHYYDAHLSLHSQPDEEPMISPTKLEDDFPGGLLVDQATGPMLAGRAGG